MRDEREEKEETLRRAPIFEKSLEDEELEEEVEGDLVGGAINIEDLERGGLEEVMLLCKRVEEAN